MNLSFNKLIAVILVIILAGALQAQTAKERMFGDVEKLLNEAKEKGAEYLSPTFYANAEASFKEANDYYIANESTRDIREKLTEAQNYANRALQVIKLAVITLKEPIKARNDALRVEANVYAKDLYIEAEELFNDAALQIEDDDLDDARDRGSEAEKRYRQAELQSIKGKILGDARELVEQAREKDVEEVAPQTFNRAEQLLKEVEDLLTYNRYAGEEAGSKAIECIYEAKHSMYLAEEIRGLREDELNWEKLILKYEEILAGFAKPFNESVAFDQGMNGAINLISTRINNLLEENQRLLSENAQLQEEYDALKEQAATSSTELARKKEREAKFEKIKNIFSANEAKVLIDRDNLVIRVHGLNFQSGKSVIQPEYFSLLTKVQEALKVFPEKHILLEGHTDSRGVPKTNKRLSEERAIAVREYLIANMGKDREQITALGYGSAKPVASNQTSDGRELNRRIDIVISLKD